MAELPFAELLERLLAGVDLGRDAARELFSAAMAGELPPERLAAVLVALRAKGETVDEIAGAAEAMRAVVRRVSAPAGAIDVCGTGGDASGTVNVSTAAALVIAAAGVPVAKHGNRSISSRSGSADLLEALGIPIDLDPEAAGLALAEHGFAFLFAPNYHPAMRHAAPVRRSLGVRTIFNLLGPLTNPAGVRRQLMGVFSERWVDPLARVLGELGAERALVVHGAGGLDELAPGGETVVAEWDAARGTIERYTLRPEEIGVEPVPLAAVRGGDAATNAEMIEGAFSTGRGPVAEWIVLNAAGGLRAATGVDWSEAVARIRETLRSGAASALLDRLRA